MTGFLATLSIGSMVLQNGLLNGVCKKKLTNDTQANFFNAVQHIVCMLIFGALLLGGHLSWYTALMGVLFGIVTALGTVYKLRALSEGPMNITLIITTSSMIIPTLSGVFFGEGFSVFKLVVALLLIGCIYLSLGRQQDGAKANGKWLFKCAVSFVFLGLVGVLQKVHQSSAYKEETSGFLFVAFVCSTLFSLGRVGRGIRTIKWEKYIWVIALLCGVCTYAMNHINLKLSGMLPSQLFFPLINGSAIVLSTVMSVVLFRERLSVQQWVGVIGGIAFLVIICLVP